ncbi:hypothetical protein QT972_34785, partial [Microcoleus sp. herbarium7]|uniref:hypothetical protein n=1 Tax=Microcoleus sp. herbarium7 TaxID=3055435 RepID=UPI002FCF5284
MGGITIRRIGQTAGGIPIQRYGFISSITATNPRGIDNDLSNGAADQFRVDLVSVVRTGGLPDNCGNPFPVDPPSDRGVSVTVNVNIPDIRIEPNVNVVIPVVILRPEFNITPTANFTFNVPINVGGVRFNFDGTNFTSETTVNIDSSSITNSISSSQTAITNSITASQTNINSNTSNAISNSQTNINSNTNSRITTSQTAINNNTTSSISSAITAINNNT